MQVMPFSTACNTPLSNFESGQNYKEVQDPSGECPVVLVYVVWTIWPYAGVHAQNGFLMFTSVLKGFGVEFLQSGCLPDVQPTVTVH